MKNTAKSLTTAEIREGVDRLMKSPYMMTASARRGDDGEPDDYSGALYAACDIDSESGPRLSGEEWGLEGQLSGVIEELGYALLKGRASAEELFRLGTSPEAIRLLEERVASWDTRAKAYHAEKVAKASEAGA